MTISTTFKRKTAWTPRKSASPTPAWANRAVSLSASGASQCRLKAVFLSRRESPLRPGGQGGAVESRLLVLYRARSEHSARSTTCRLACHFQPLAIAVLASSHNLVLRFTGVAQKLDSRPPCRPHSGGARSRDSHQV